MTEQPTPAQREAAWRQDDPRELRRHADTYERLGYVLYARHLRAWAAWYDGTGPRPHAYVRPR